MLAFAGLAPIGGLWAGWVMDVGGTSSRSPRRRGQPDGDRLRMGELPALRARHAAACEEVARGLGRGALGFGAEDALEFLEVPLECLPARVGFGRGSASGLRKRGRGESEAPGASGQPPRPSRPGRRRAGEPPRSPGRARRSAGRVARSRSRPGPRGRARLLEQDLHEPLAADEAAGHDDLSEPPARAFLLRERRVELAGRDQLTLDQNSPSGRHRRSRPWFLHRPFQRNIGTRLDEALTPAPPPPPSLPER